MESVKEVVKKGFIQFCERSTEYSAMISWFDSIKENNIHSVLSIGSGEGKLDFLILSRFPGIRYVSIEPDKESVEKFQKVIKNSQYTGSVICLNDTFENYQSDEKFDLIILSQCLYYMPDRQESILAAIRLLSSRGKIVIFHQTQLGIYEIQEKFGITKYHYSNVELEKDLDILRVPYEINIIDSEINLKSYPDDIVHFFMEKQCSSKEIQKVRDYIFNKYCDRLYHPVAAISISQEMLTGVKSWK